MKGIIMSGESVLATLDGRKTMTRRPINLPKFLTSDHIDEWREANGMFQPWGDCGMCNGILEPKAPPIKPHYQPGDILYVRETFADLRPGNLITVGGRQIVYKAGPMVGDKLVASLKEKTGKGWTPAIHMPKDAARLFLLVKNVRVERLQEITEADARAEGVNLLSHDGMTIYTENYRKAFRVVWDSLNAKRGYPFDLNPWVFAYEYELTEVKPCLTENGLWKRGQKSK